MGRAHAARADGGDGGRRRAVSSAARRSSRFAAPDVQGHHWCRVTGAGGRDPPAEKGTAGRTNESPKLTYPSAKGCTFCGHCPQGCIEPVKSAAQHLRASGSTHTSYVPVALTADRWTRGKTSRCCRTPSRCASRPIACHRVRRDTRALRTECVDERGRRRSSCSLTRPVIENAAAMCARTAASPISTRSMGRPRPLPITTWTISWSRFTTVPPAPSKGADDRRRGQDFPRSGGSSSRPASSAGTARRALRSDLRCGHRHGFYDNAGGRSPARGCRRGRQRVVGGRLKRFMASNVDQVVIGVALITDDDVSLAAEPRIDATPRR